MATWSTIPGRTRSMHSVQVVTEGAPAAGDGIDLAMRSGGGGVGSVVPVLRAPTGQTFTGAGFIRAWLWVPCLGRWIRAPRADDDLADLAGLFEGALTAIKITWSVGRLALVFEGAGLSGGTAPELDMACSSAGGDDI